MAVPSTSGSLVTSLTGMRIGDYIVCNYNAYPVANRIGFFDNFGGIAGTEILLAGEATPNGTFYYIKVDKGLLIADRVLQHSITWFNLNSSVYIQGGFWSATPIMTSNTSPSGIVSASSFNTGGFDPWKAFTRTVDDGWATASGQSGWLAYEFPSPKIIIQYKLSPWYDATTPREPYMAKDWTFEGSNNGTNWTVLDTRTTETNWTVKETRTYTVNNVTSYKMYRLNVTQNNNSSVLFIGEMAMMERLGVIRSLTGGVSYADATGNSVNVAPAPQLGGWPTNSEYDKYLIKSNLNGTITANDINVWHHDTVQTWTQDTPALAIAVSSNRVTRGGSTGVKNMQNSTATTNSTTVGFRPAYQYQE